MRKPVVLVAALLGLQLGAHMWLEAVHPHAHVAAAGGASHSHGVSGAIAHALTPGMIMMWAHFAAVIAAVTLLGLMRPLLHALAYVVAQLHAIRLVPIVSQYPLRPVCIGLPTLSLRGLTRTTPRRGPPIFA